MWYMQIDLLWNLTTPTALADKTFNPLVGILKKHYEPKRLENSATCKSPSREFGYKQVTYRESSYKQVTVQLQTNHNVGSSATSKLPSGHFDYIKVTLWRIQESSATNKSPSREFSYKNVTL